MSAEMGQMTPLMPLPADALPVPSLPSNDLPLASSLPPTSLDIFQKTDRLDFVNRLQVTDPIEGFTFTPRQERFSRDLLAATGLPLDHVSSFAYRPNTHGHPNTIGSAEYGGIHDGRVSFYENMGLVSAVEQLAVATHELAHVNSPSLERNNDVYGGELNRQRAARNVLKVAWQSAATGVFLNEYHQEIYNRWQSGSVDSMTWFEETHAILMEMAATNREQLEIIDQEQYRRLSLHGLSGDFTPLASRQDPNTREVNLTETDWTLMTLMGFENLEDVREHFRHLRHVLQDVQTPFNETRPIPLPPIIVERIIIQGYIPRHLQPWEQDILDLLGIKSLDTNPLRHRYGSIQ